MKKIIILLLFTVFSSHIDLFAKSDPKKELELLQTVLKIIKSRHIVNKKIDDEFSKKLLNTYLKELDGYGYIFLQSDIEEFSKYETKLDDQILNNDLTFFNLTRDRLYLRMRETKEIYTNLLKNKLDFTKNEIKELNQYKGNRNIFKKNKTELIEYYSKGMKSMVLDHIKNLYNENSTQKELDELVIHVENNILPKILANSAYDIDNISQEFIFQKYINAIVLQFDSYSKYYLPYLRDEYFVTKTGKIEGVGMSMSLKDNLVQIDKLSIGGPAWKTNKIAVGDVILKIAQENEKPINVAGFTTYDVAKLTRRKSGTNLKLTLKKVNGAIETVSITRGIVSTNESNIKSCLVTKNKIKFGVLSFSRFYNELDGNEIRNVTDDFEQELIILKQAEIQGLIVDMRNNDGGLINDATKILSNFVAKNDVAQYKNKENQSITIKSNSEIKKWEKHIVLLVNSKTAGAAEMIASSFQELNIGIIVGESTFGNGTTQDFLDLNTFKVDPSDNTDFGSLKITTQKFYNLNGKSIQKIGVIPDLDFSSKNIIKRENLNMYALNPDQVKPIEVNRVHTSDYFIQTIKNNQAKLSKNKVYEFVKNDSFKYDVENMHNLNTVKFKNTFDALLLKQSNSPLKEYNNNLEFTSTSNDEKTFKKKEYLLQKRKDWYKSLTQDFQIEQSLSVLEDMLSLK